MFMSSLRSKGRGLLRIVFDSAPYYDGVGSAAPIQIVAPIDHAPVSAGDFLLI